MGEILGNPWIQGGLGPLLAAIAATLVFYPMRLSGLAAAFGFFAAGQAIVALVYALAVGGGVCALVWVNPGR